MCNKAPEKYNFGPALAGDVPLVITMIITNTTKSFPLSILSIGGIANPNFSVTTTCPMGSETLAPQSSCGAEIAFHPTSGGEFQYSAVVRFSAGSGSPALTSFVPMTGTGVAPLVFSGVNPIDPAGVTTTSINLTWTPIDQVSSYAVLGGVSGSALSTLDYASSSASGLTVQHLNPATSYTFQVKALDLLGNLDPNTVTQGFSTDTLGSFSAPTALSASENMNVVSSNIGLSCTDARGHYPTFVALLSQSDPDVNCTLLTAPYRVSCTPLFKTGHANWSSTLSLSCLLNNYPQYYTQTLSVNVMHVDRPPVLSGLGNLMVEAGTLLTSNTPVASDPNAYSLSYSCQSDGLVDGSVSSTAPACSTLLNQDGSQASFNSVTGLLEWTPPLGMSNTQREVQITVTNGRLSTSAIIVISIGAPPPSASQSTLTLSSNSIYSGSSTTVTLQAKDNAGNSLTTGGSNVIFSTTGGLSTVSFAPTVDHGNGIYTAQATGVVSGTATTLHASLQGVPVTTTLPTLSVTPGPLSPRTSFITLSSSSLASGSTLTVTLIGKDDAGNLRTSGGGSIAFGISGGTSTGSFSSVTDSNNGIYTAVFTAETSGTATTVTGSVNSVGVTSSPLPQITVGIGGVSLSQSLFSLTQSTLVAGSTARALLVLKDQAGNLIQDASQASQLTFGIQSSGTSQGTLGPILAVSGSPGSYQATFTATSSGTTNTLQAQYSRLGIFTSIPSFTVSASGSSQSVSTVTSSPLSVTDDDVTQSQITVTLKDGNGNPVPGKSVNLNSNRQGSDTISAPSGLSNSQGVVNFYVRSKTLGTSTYTATDTTESLTLTQTAQVSYTAGAVSSSQSTVVSSPATNVTANNLNTSTITVTLLDSTGNPVSGKTTSLSSNRSGSDTITPLTPSTNSFGQATFSIKSTTSGNSILTASDVTDSLLITQTSSVTFVSGSVSASQSTVTGSPLTLSANNVATSTITVTLLDAYNNLISGKTVSLTSDRGTYDTISPASAATTLGKASFTLSSNQPGTSVISALDVDDSLPVTQTVTLTFTPQIPSVLNSTVTFIPASLPADNNTQSTVTVTLLDSNRVPVANRTVSLSSTRGATDTFLPQSSGSATSNSSGQAIFTITSAKVGMPVLTATDVTDSIVLTQKAQPTFLSSGSFPLSDYQASLANLNSQPGNNILPVSQWKDASQLSSINDGLLRNFNYSVASGWSGDGTLNTASNLGPFRLNFGGSSEYLDLGGSMNGNTAYSFEAWIRPTAPTSSGSMILTNSDSSSRGFSISQSSGGTGLLSMTSASYASVVLADSPTSYWKFNETSGSTANDYSGNSNTGTYYTPSTGFTFGQPSLIGNSDTSVFFPGTGTTSGATVYTNYQVNTPNTFTLEAWFNTTTTTGGKILGMGNYQNGISNGYDRHVYMTNSGGLIFGVNPSPVVTITASGPYNDGTNHHVVATLSPNGMFLYVDGALISSNASITSGQSLLGYWRVGGDNIQNWPNPPTNYFFSGNLEHVAIYPTALSLARVQAHYQAARYSCNSLSSLVANAWTYIAGVVNLGNQTGNLYVNGNLQCSVSVLPSPSSQDLIVGGATTLSNFWSGNLATLRTYGLALTSSQVRANYAANAAKFDLNQLGAPVPLMWLRADAIQGLSDGANVSTWKDMTQYGNDATQGVAANQPTWKNNVINGYPTIRFNGSTSYLNGQSVFPTMSDYTLFAVIKTSTSCTTSCVMLGSPYDKYAFYVYANALRLNQNGSGSTASTNPIFMNTPYLVEAIYVNASLLATYYINGVSSGTTNPPAAIPSGTGANIQIGADLTNYFFSGDIAEILLYGSALSSQDRSLIESYLNSKYGIY